jgi:hypothetical protein
MLESREYKEARIQKLIKSIAQIPKGTTIKEVKAAFVEHVVNHCGGNRTHAARELDVPLRTLRYWIYEVYKLDIPYPASAPKNNGKDRETLKTARKRTVQVRIYKKKGESHE